MRIALCDDTKEDLDLLTGFLNNYETQHSISIELHIYNSGEKLLADHNVFFCNCIFLDIYMPGISGMECAHYLREQGYSDSFVFITTSKEHVFESFKVDVTDYLLKPYDYERFSFTMDKLVKKYSTKPKYITIMSDGAQIAVPIQDISYIDTGVHYCMIHTKEKLVRTSMTITKLESFLKNDNFLRCHQSFLVNMNQIIRVDESTLTMSTGDTVLISVRRLNQIKRRIAQFMWNKAREEKG